MAQRIFIIDTEAASPTPATGPMTEFGVVDFATREWFHGHLWDFTPHPDIPALPVPTHRNCGVTIFDGIKQSSTYTPGATDRDTDEHEHTVFASLYGWVLAKTGRGDRAVFVSDNPGFDFMWLAYGFDSHGVPNPFGHSSRRIGDLAAGLSGNWRNASGWKKHRRTTHDHNPVNDALGNAEALEHLLRKHEQRF